MSCFSKKKCVRAIVLFLTIVITMLSNTINTHAFGISTPYLENDILKVNPGKNYVYTLTIQNGEDIEYYVNITHSSTDNIVKLKENIYRVFANSYNTKVYFEIYIPAGAKIGETYILDYSVRPTSNNTSEIPLGIEIKRNLKIQVTTEDSPENIPILNTNTGQEKNKQVILKHKTETAIKYLLIILTIVASILVVIRLWRLSKGISSKIGSDRVTTYTISKSINIIELKEVIEKMSEEEFELIDLKELIIQKLIELNKQELSETVFETTKYELIRTLKKNI